ncbi:MAG: peptidase [Aeromicrobium sp.]|nr:peptidase [Aeromicrobium sp.]
MTALSISHSLTPVKAKDEPGVSTTTSVTIDRDVELTLSDGTILRSDLYRTDAMPKPVILLRTPYDKSAHAFTFSGAIDPIRAAQAGYHVLFQDVRGRYASDGEFHPFVNERADGAETIDWIALQPWSDGNVVTTGASYCGATQLLAAAANPAALRGMFPIVTGSDYAEGWTYQGGAMQLGFAYFWALSSLAPNHVTRRIPSQIAPQYTARVLEELDGIGVGYRRAPAQDQPLFAEIGLDFWRAWFANRPGDPYWTELAPNQHYDDIVAPGHHMGGWFDIFLEGTLENYAELAKRNPGNRLIVGPWTHNGWGDRLPGAAYGHQASRDFIDLDGLQLAYFDTVLSGRPLTVSAPVRLFVMGSNVWRDEESWPPARTVEQKLYPNTDGSLTTEPSVDAGSVTYEYRLADPAPTLGGSTLMPGPEISANAGPRDHGAPGLRADVLSFQTAPLHSPVEVTGRITAEIVTSLTTPSADIVIRALDVHPDGRAILLAEGISRVQRDGAQQTVLVTVGSTSNAFLRGHRIRIDVTSSSFPRFDRNPDELGDGLDDREITRTFVLGGPAAASVNFPTIDGVIDDA